ncbi:MAG: hypothetical protein A3H98_06040 [Bacteroidetes bacterium RIFCSPLOWO2_02_FULL_36_8]|nr:MAG: hypothetical protein A3H98_06040 [Bacteroidetes bacterium RIFCSPLOWO2_02_FULL_36_8]OFY69030.1 MAG: hypothetical protein A3G23_13185 [Bacteroidetes bacterium RIFCSPLOWO2_12_FULL_37_12]
MLNEKPRIIILLILSFFLLFKTICLAQIITPKSDSLKLQLPFPGDTTITLQEVNIFSLRNRQFSAGIKTDKMDSSVIGLHVNRSLAELMQFESNLFVKSYGPGNISVTSFRGGSAQHTAVLWDGINLNNPMTGQLDLTTVPGFFLEEVEIQHGGAGALWGSGSVGGTVHLKSSPIKKKSGTSVSFGASAGSFSNFTQNIMCIITQKRKSSTFKIFNASAKNDFENDDSYKKLFYGASVTQKNPTVNQNGVLNENTFHINAKQSATLSLWYQKIDKLRPVSIYDSLNFENQNDRSFRVNSSWKKSTHKILYVIRGAYLNENMRYKDDLRMINSNHQANSFIMEEETKLSFSDRHSILIGINNTYLQLNSTEYDMNSTLNRVALFSSYRFNAFNDKFIFNFSARKEYAFQNNSPLTWSAGIDYRTFDWLLLKAMSSRVFRFPTINDRYWSPGGNAGLLPEDGYGHEIGCKLQFVDKKNKTEFLAEPVLFTRTVKNWIIWLPSGNYWSPQNLMEVWSRGMETSFKLNVKTGKWQSKFSLLTNYILSTNEKSKVENDYSVGKQIIYVPMYSGNGTATLIFRKVSLSIQEQYIRYRYTSTDNTEYLNPYWLTRLVASYELFFKTYCFTVSGSIDNLFNENYQIVRSWQMPFRNYQVGLNLRLD